ncbi:hypothetical protein FH972_010210 [Carpinus fangiana]|uniref:YABBY protein C-terminal domain-containing protein n=1 Tax=Carpinus fangiana TaxID=176857 RepID=A0A660KMJ9_9ROSI|nr:hypothetical protein FH972_010210 [Carpinus fangiana]
MGASLQAAPPQVPQKQHQSSEDSGSSSKCNKFSAFETPEKRQRVPSAYNRFIKEEIQRIKASNPDISHREAFSTAAKNWAHFPHIHFGQKVDGNKQAKLDQAFAGSEGIQKSNGHGFY